MRDKHDEGIKKMCSTGIRLGRSKLIQSCSNFTICPVLVIGHVLTVTLSD